MTDWLTFGLSWCTSVSKFTLAWLWCTETALEGNVEVFAALWVRERCVKVWSWFRSDQGGLSFWMFVCLYLCLFVCLFVRSPPPLNQITYFGRILFRITCTKMAKLKITPTQNPLQTFAPCLSCCLNRRRHSVIAVQEAAQKESRKGAGRVGRGLYNRQGRAVL